MNFQCCSENIEYFFIAFKMETQFVELFLPDFFFSLGKKNYILQFLTHLW